MKKILIPIIAVLFIALLIVGGTYSFLIAGANGNNSSVTANSISHNIIFTKGTNLTGDLEPTSNNPGNMYASANIRVSNNSSKPLVDVYINIESLSQGLGISALKWEVVATKGGNSVTLSSTSGDFASCTHNGVLGPCVTGDKIYVASGYELDTVDTEFKVYIWLDGSLIDTNISNAVLNASLGAEISKFTGTVLPVEYQQVVYVHFSGAQIINTGVSPSTYNGNYAVEIEEKHSNNSSNMYIFGTKTEASNDGSRANIRIDAGGTKCYYFVNNSSNQGTESISVTNKLALNSKNYIMISADSTNVRRFLKVNDYTSPTSTTAFVSVSTTTFRVGGYNTTAQYVGDIYSVKIYGNGTLVRDLIPCYRRSDGKVGFYDVVNNNFYINIKSGDDLTAGQKINA